MAGRLTHFCNPEQCRQLAAKYSSTYNQSLLLMRCVPRPATTPATIIPTGIIGIKFVIWYLSILTQVGETATAIIMIEQGSLAAVIASSINIGTAVYNIIKGEVSDNIG